MASLFKVKALYDFEAKEEDDLGFPSGQIIDITEEVDDNWLEGRYLDATGATHAGIFPREFVEKYEPDVPTRPTRPTRPKTETAPLPPPSQAITETKSVEPELQRQEPQLPPPAPAISRHPVDVAPTAVKPEEKPAAPAQAAVPKMSTVSPAPSSESAAAAKKPPPPIAAKSNAFRDRIAAFNAPAAAPITPMQPGGPKTTASSFIKKPFVAPPPSAHSYVPPPRAETVTKPYIRDEDPEIKQRQEEDNAAAESAGLLNEAGNAPPEETEDAPKPQSLKERIARLQQQQMEQAQRRADTTQKKERKAPSKTTSEDTGALEAGQDDAEEAPSTERPTTRSSMDAPAERPAIPISSRRPPEPPVSASELLSDGNDADQSAAGETTEDDNDAGTIGPDSDEVPDVPIPLPRAVDAPKREADVGDEDDTTEDAEEGEEEDEVDEETRRKLELRERMAKMSGGMGMAGMFGPPGGMALPGAASIKKRPAKEKTVRDEPTQSESLPQQRVPMIPVMGMPNVPPPQSNLSNEQEEARDEEDRETFVPPVPSRASTMGADRSPPPVPKDSRPLPPLAQDRAPPLPPTNNAPTPRQSLDARRVPPTPSEAPFSPGPGSESDDEASMHDRRSVIETPGVETPVPLPIRSAAPPVPGVRESSRPRASMDAKRSSYFGSEPSSAASEKRMSRLPPPVPGATGAARPPPPPPPAANSEPFKEDRMESDYEGDYDTDIGSSVKHKDALKAHAREPSLDDSTDTPVSSPPPPPPPHAAVPRAVPPPPPTQTLSKSRQSADLPRAPPPVPPTRDVPSSSIDDYDPYSYSGSKPVPPMPASIPAAVPPPVPRAVEPPLEHVTEDSEYPVPPPRTAAPTVRAVPPPPESRAPVSTEPAAPPPTTPSRAARASLDVQRSGSIRRSMDDQGQIAKDVPLNPETPWWTSSRPLPPALQSRLDIDLLTECEESTTTARGGKSTTSKEIYILYMDYSQTIISVKYNTKEPLVAQLDQAQKPPPPKLRQDQLESSWERFGAKIAEVARSHAHSKKDSVVGDGSPTALPLELIKALPDALSPVGSRAYGALVYANLANASTMQFDEIRPGDVITVRNAKFEGHHGAMKSKYKQEYGPSHVAIVDEWDGTKRAIRIFEQGREKKASGVKSDKLRLADLRSGEVRVWRVVGREYVEW